MDSSKHNLSTEECGCSESGWTMHIASPMQEDENECSDNDNDHNTIANDGNANDDDDDDDGVQDSDDSMASDASSGPHHRANRGTSFMQDKSRNFKHCSPATKPNKKEKQNDENSTEGFLLTENTASSLF
ncbi:hypothetical protein P3X46_016287 [Hevea brasiliensis]|uniref:Uncharacterized protein n=1 Tax=Hevea brasiliensis TaxID=3981 RepID=A0ABQ9M2K1_HEVBR|nr:hypothetical protein P3X46_016287 [Hevea brasiliensis]